MIVPVFRQSIPRKGTGASGGCYTAAVVQCVLVGNSSRPAANRAVTGNRCLESSAGAASIDGAVVDNCRLVSLGGSEILVTGAPV